MPVMDGLKASAIISEISDIKIIGITAYAGEEYRMKCEQAGMVGRLTKPLNVDKLKEVLKRH